jgi:hypothetical protein
MENWVDTNQRALVAGLARVRDALIRHAAGTKTNAATKEKLNLSGGLENDGKPDSEGSRAGTTDLTAPAGTALANLCEIFSLSAFERDVVLLCAGIELDSAFAAHCAAASGDQGKTYPSFSLAFAALAEPHWSALLPVAPLRRCRLIELSSGEPITTSPLRIDERILHYLAGLSYLDERLQGRFELVASDGQLPESQQTIADQLLALWRQGAGNAIELFGNDDTARRRIPAAACAALGVPLFAIRANDIPGTPAEREALIRLWERETLLTGCVLLVDCDRMDNCDPAQALIEGVRRSVLITAREPLRECARPLVKIEVCKPSPVEQDAIWLAALQPLASRLNGHIQQITSQFDLDARSIQAAGAELNARCFTSQTEARAQLWDICRSQSRRRLDGLAQRIEPVAEWDDLVLPEPQRQILREMALHVRHRVTVHERWGFSKKSARGLGISALFSGASGTGKTMAAEVLANELRLDLFRIDLSSVVSKYIGETEKNLAHVFDSAETGGAILLFDEADALFGKRSEVKDSHDRYANIEISYLLQRMESYRGLAILTTNMKSALDPAFLRRLRFVVQFPFPDAAQRAEIWRRVFPAATPTNGLDFTRLARLNLPGGNIRNIALRAAFLAAHTGEPVRMAHLLGAARSEYAKIEQPLTETEIGGWT